MLSLPTTSSEDLGESYPPMVGLVDVHSTGSYRPKRAPAGAGVV